MNWKHFLRGLGAGIIFSALIMLVAYMTSGSYKISDEEIIERATKLGMVMDDKTILSSEDTVSEEAQTEVISTEKQTTEAEKVVSEEEVTEATTEIIAETTEATTEATTELTTEAATEEITEEKIESSNTVVEITVSRGMSSEAIAKLVQDAGIIDDYLDFDNYLNTNGYSNKLSVNTFKLHSGMTYEEIAKELTKGDK